MTVTHPLPGAGSPLAQVFLFISHCTIRANGTMSRAGAGLSGRGAGSSEFKI